MDLLQDSRWTMCDLNSRLRGFLEQVKKLQEDNQRLEGHIAGWCLRNIPQTPVWSQQERAVDELRSQVAKLLMENAQLALQSSHMKSRAGQIQTRCEMEERQTKCLEQQVALLRENKRQAELTNMKLETDLHHSMTELQEMHQEVESARALQQRADCDALLVPAAGQEEDGTGMELSQLLDRILQAQPAAGQPSQAAAGSGGGSLSQEEAAWLQVSLGGAALREARAELAQAKRQWHSLQVEIQTLHALEKGLEGSLQTTQREYSHQLQDLSQVISDLEGELEQVRGGLACQRQRHSQLLNTKMKLEQEITTYRRLLEREEGRFMVRNVQGMGLRPWGGLVLGPKENGLDNSFSDPALTPDEPKSEPLPDISPLHLTDEGLKGPGTLRRQQSLVLLTEPERDSEFQISTVKTQEILQGNVVRESAEGRGTVETEKIDKVIKQWEGSFFKGNPKLRKKSVSLRFDLHMAAADEGCDQTKQDSLPDVEVRLVMKRSCSISAITQ
ncbi:keratin-like protein KRT222 [Aplochiton taeniatus]